MTPPTSMMRRSCLTWPASPPPLGHRRSSEPRMAEHGGAPPRPARFRANAAGMGSGRCMAALNPPAPQRARRPGSRRHPTASQRKGNRELMAQEVRRCERGNQVRLNREWCAAVLSPREASLTSAVTALLSTVARSGGGHARFVGRIGLLTSNVGRGLTHSNRCRDPNDTSDVVVAPNAAYGRRLCLAQTVRVGPHV
jgi:hypothetical protein